MDKKQNSTREEAVAQNLTKTKELFKELQKNNIGEVDYRTDYTSQDKAYIERETRLIDVSALNIKGRNDEQILAYKLYQDNILAKGNVLITVQTNADNVYTLSSSDDAELAIAFEALGKLQKKKMSFTPQEQAIPIAEKPAAIKNKTSFLKKVFDFFAKA